MIGVGYMAKKIFNFHGAFGSKKSAVRKERETPHSFIEKFGYGKSHRKRYVVVTRKRGS